MKLQQKKSRKIATKVFVVQIRVKPTHISQHFYVYINFHVHQEVI